MELVYGVYNCEVPRNIDNEKPLYKGSLFQCQRFVNATVGFDAFIGGTNWTDYQIFVVGTKGN